LEILLVTFLADRPRFPLRFEIRDLIDQSVFAFREIFASFPASERFSVQLKRVADAPGKERSGGEDDKPSMRAHGVGNIGSSRAFILREEHEQRHQCLSFAPHSAQNLLVSGLGEPHEEQAVVGMTVLALFLRAEISRRISASRSASDSMCSIS